MDTVDRGSESVRPASMFLPEGISWGDHKKKRRRMIGCMRRSAIWNLDVRFRFSRPVWDGEYRSRVRVRDR